MKLDSTTATVEEVEQMLELVKQRKRKVFIPKEGELYCFIDEHGDAEWRNNEGSTQDYHYINSGNCYRTKEEAIKAVTVSMRKLELSVSCVNMRVSLSIGII